MFLASGRGDFVPLTPPDSDTDTRLYPWTLTSRSRVHFPRNVRQKWRCHPLCSRHCRHPLCFLLRWTYYYREKEQNRCYQARFLGS